MSAVGVDTQCSVPGWLADAAAEQLRPLCHAAANPSSAEWQAPTQAGANRLLWPADPVLPGPGLVKALLPEVAHLLRHPCGASVVSALYDRASAEQRNAMAATFYGKEFSVLSQVLLPQQGQLRTLCVLCPSFFLGGQGGKGHPELL